MCGSEARVRHRWERKTPHKDTTIGPVKIPGNGILNAVKNRIGGKVFRQCACRDMPLLVQRNAGAVRFDSCGRQKRLGVLPVIIHQAWNLESRLPPAGYKRWLESVTYGKVPRRWSLCPGRAIGMQTICKRDACSKHARGCNGALSVMSARTL